MQKHLRRSQYVNVGAHITLFGVWGLGFGVTGLGCRVSGLGVGVQILRGCGVCDLGCRV